MNSKLEKRGRYFQFSLCYVWLKSFKIETIEVLLIFQWVSLYYIHFEISGDPCNLIGSHQCDFFTNHTIFALNHVLNRTIFALYLIVSDSNTK